jgi:hypothetical protein
LLDFAVSFTQLLPAVVNYERTRKQQLVPGPVRAPQKSYRMPWWRHGRPQREVDEQVCTLKVSLSVASATLCEGRLQRVSAGQR